MSLSDCLLGFQSAASEHSARWHRNKELIEIDQDPLGIVGGLTEEVNGDEELQVWARPLVDGTLAVALFNSKNESASMSADFGKLPPTAGPHGGAKWGAGTHASVRDLWAHKALADATGRFSATVAPHETVVVKLAAKTDDEPVEAKPDDTVSGYWRLPGKRSSAVSKNSTTKQCAAAATGVTELAACCSDDPGCGGFAQSGTIHSASCATSILCPPECARTGDSGCNCPASPAHGASSTLYVKSDVPQGGGALPTQAQLAWQEREVGAFVSWTIEEHCGPLGSGASDFPNCWRHTPGSCTSQPDCGDCPDPDKFVISDDRFTDQWAASMRDLGVKYAVMVLKQHCGWTMWPTNVTLPDGSRYSYGVASSPAKRNIAKEFADSCRKFNITPGFYMLMGSNAFLGVINNKLTNNPHVQHNVTLDEYNAICLKQLTELWSGFGSLAEVWFDGGFVKSMQPAVVDLFAKLQPNGVVFNGPGTPVGPQNALRWVGSERGYAPYPNWLTTFRDGKVPAVTGGGDPDGLIYAPAVCDTTLQSPTSTWLYDPFDSAPRNLTDLKLLYHQSVGRSCGLELNFAPMPNGTLAPNFVSRLREFGGWIKACYGIDAAVPGTKQPVGVASDLSGATVKLSLSSAADRLVLQEELKHGQRIRSFSVTDANGDAVYAGLSLGHKHIALLNRTVSGQISVTVSAEGGPQGQSAPPPRLRRAAAYSGDGC